MNKKIISIVTPTYNEEDNVAELIARISAAMEKMSDKYDYEHIVIDNASNDSTVDLVKREANFNKRLKLILNTRNFGPVRSPYYGVINAKGDAVVLLASDLQDPPELLDKYIGLWEMGFKIVLATKPVSEENYIVNRVRKLYYYLLNIISEEKLEPNATGAGLYDKEVIIALRALNDPYPYFRGLICDLGFSRCTVDFVQPRRKGGCSKATLYGLIDQALLAMTKHSKVPIRLMTIIGFFLGIGSFLLSAVFLLLKILFWDSYTLGIAPLLIGGCFIGGLQLFFLGILGEYLSMVLIHVRKMPLVVEAERINFND